MTRQQRGFTLIEIMIAVAILAIVASIAISAYQGYIVEARFGTAMKDIRQAEVILQDLALESGLAAIEPAGYSGSLIGVYQQGNGLILGSIGTPPAGATAWNDPWGNLYRYQRNTGTNSGVRTDAGGAVSNNAANTPAPQSFDLFSLGPDSSDASDDIMRGCNGEFVGTAGGHSCP